MPIHQSIKEGVSNQLFTGRVICNIQMYFVHCMAPVHVWDRKTQLIQVIQKDMYVCVCDLYTIHIVRYGLRNGLTPLICRRLAYIQIIVIPRTKSVQKKAQEFVCGRVGTRNDTWYGIYGIQKQDVLYATYMCK